MDDRTVTPANRARGARRRAGRPAAAQRRRHRSELGTAVAELALVVPIFLVLVMGIIDFGMIANEKIGLTGGVREASWNSSRAIFGSACPANYLTYTTAPTAETQKVMCMVKLRSGIPVANIRVKVRLVNLASTGTAGTYTTGNAIMVCAMSKVNSTTKFFAALLNGKLQKARLTTAILTLSANTSAIANAEETSLDGNSSSWSFCDPTQSAPN